MIKSTNSLAKWRSFFRKIEEENKSIKSLKPVASMSVEGVNFDAKVFFVPGVSKGIEFREGMPKLYVSKGFSLSQQYQSFLTKLKESIFVKLIPKLSVSDSKVVSWNYNKIGVYISRKEDC